MAYSVAEQTSVVSQSRSVGVESKHRFHRYSSSALALAIRPVITLTLQPFSPPHLPYPFISLSHSLFHSVSLYSSLHPSLPSTSSVSGHCAVKDRPLPDQSMTWCVLDSQARGRPVYCPDSAVKPQTISGQLRVRLALPEESTFQALYTVRPISLYFFFFLQYSVQVYHALKHLSFSS